MAGAEMARQAVRLITGGRWRRQEGDMRAIGDVMSPYTQANRNDSGGMRH